MSFKPICSGWCGPKNIREGTVRRKELLIVLHSSFPMQRYTHWYHHPQPKHNVQLRFSLLLIRLVNGYFPVPKERNCGYLLG
uniref:Uncharacterized protein n=1 Tax=Anguilla anguilla TaxID=7936 RepID=A0A0E9X2Y9_ANGAN